MYLVDTSAWIAHFSSADNFRLQDECLPEEIHISPPVYQELLQGLKQNRRFGIIRQLLLECVMVDSPLPLERFEEAAELFRLGRRTGATVRSSTDCLIAASALRYDLSVLHRDRDYSLIAGYSGLRQKRV